MAGFACVWGLITGFEDGYFYLSWYATFGYCGFDTKRLPIEMHWVQTEYLAGGANDTVAEIYRKQIGSEMYYSCVSAQDKYVAALYWAIMTITSIGYGDIRAPDGNSWEQAFGCILMLLGGMIWGSVIATFCGVIANMNPAQTEFRQTSARRPATYPAHAPLP